MGTRVEAAGTKGLGILPSLGDLVPPFYPDPGLPSLRQAQYGRQKCRDPSVAQRTRSFRMTIKQDDNQTG